MSSRLEQTVLSLLLLLGSAAPLAAQSCPGDCDGSSEVTVAELVQAVNIALGAPRDGCAAADGNGDGSVTVNELVAAVAAALDGCPISVTAMPTATPTPTGSPGMQLPPTSAAELTAWLRAGHYKRWTAESAVHDSLGPHFGNVRTYLNDALIGSLQEARPAHPQGAAVVKELYGEDTQSVEGWAVMVKVREDSAGGNGWYWYEHFGSSTFASGTGVSLCAGCHSRNYNGLPNRDFLLTPYPLQ